MNAARLAASPRTSRERDEQTGLVYALVDGVPADERSLLVELLARSFVELYARAAAGGSSLELIDWAERMCDAHAESPSVTTFFNTASSSLVAYCAFPGRARLDLTLLRTLEPSLRAIAAKPRRSFPKLVDHVNEVDAAINGLIMQLERADPLSAEHSRAVSAWCARLARRMSLSDEEVLHVARCGLVHDVGKVTTPIDILHAPRKLTEGEWVLMRDHAPAGERLVLQNPRLGVFAGTVRSHHERLDGKGYPDGVDGDQISLCTRIVTVADCFNAMIGRRPYRLPMPPSVAMEQLTTHSGTQFDAAVVAAMRDVV